MSALNRIDELERSVRMLMQAPTIPIYDSANLPQDAVRGQIAVGSDASFNWFGGTNWHTQAGTPSATGNVPQDMIDGQIAIGTDGSFHWAFGGTWYSAAFQSSIIGNVPQDVLKGQVVIGTDGTFHWFGGTNWHTFGVGAISNILKAKSDFVSFFNPAYAIVDLGSSLTDIWMSCDIGFNDPLIANLKSNFGVGFLVIEFNPTLSLGSGRTYIQPHSYDGVSIGWDLGDTLDEYNETPTSPISGSTWYHIDYRVYYNSGVFSPEFFVNNTDMSVSHKPSAPSSSNRYVMFGVDSNFSPHTEYDVYFKNVKLGTTKGASDLFDGTLSSTTVVPPFDDVTPFNAETSGQLSVITAAPF